MTRQSTYRNLVTVVLLALVVSVIAGAMIRYQRQNAPRDVRVAFSEYPGRQTIDPDTGKPSGFFVDLLEHLAKRQNLVLEYVMVERAEGAARFYWVETCHIGMPITITEERMKIVDFSWPCDYIDIVPAGRSGEGAVLDPRAMKDKRVGVMLGSIQSEYARELHAAERIADIETFNSSPELFEALLNGGVDLILEEINTLKLFSRKYPGTIDIFKDPAFTFEKFGGFPVRKGEDWLLNRLNTGVRQAMNDGSYLQIYRKHFADDAPQTDPPAGLPPDKAHFRLPKVEIEAIHDARSILDNYFDLISMRYSDRLDQKLIEQMEAFISEIRWEFDDKLYRAQTRLKELLLLIESSPENTPYAAAFYFRQVDDLRSGVSKILSTLNDILIDKEHEHITAENNLKMIENLEIPHPELRWRKAWIDINIRPLIEARQKNIQILHDMIEQGTQVLEGITGAAAQTELYILDSYKKYFVHKFSFLASPRGFGIAARWGVFSDALKDWLVILPTYIMVSLPLSHLWPMLFQLLFVYILAAGAVFLLLRRIRFEFDRFGRPLLFACFGIYFTLAYSLLPSNDQVLFYKLSAVLLSLTIVDIAWKLGDPPFGNNRVNLFMLLLLSVFIISIMTGLLAPYPVLLWALITLGGINLLAVALLYLFEYRTGHAETKMPLIVLTGMAVVWIITVVSAWLGFLYPSILFAVCGVLVLCVFFAGVSFSRFLAATTQRLAKSRQVFASFVSSLVIPFLWLAMLLGAIHWTTEIFNAERVILHLYRTDLLPTMPFKITLRLIFYLGVVGLLVKFTLDWLNEFMLSIASGRRLDSGTVNTTMLAVRYLVWIGFVVYALSLLSFDWNNMKWVVGGLSVGFGFAFKNVIENFFCGIIVLLGREIRPGDIIQYDDICGTVEKINVRATFVKTFDNAIISIPNSEIVAKDFRNWTLNDRIRRTQLDVGVRYGSDVPLVIKTLKEAMDECGLVTRFRDPQVHFAEFSDSALIFRLRFWIHVDNWLSGPSAVRQIIEEKFRFHGIVIAFPQLDVHFEPPSEPPMLPAEIKPAT